MALSRTDRSRLTEWWFTVDHQLLTGVLVLLVVGVILSLAAGPTVALKKGLEPYHFVERHVFHALIGGASLAAISMLSPVGIRRFSLVVFGVSVVLMGVALIYGMEINGSRRWIRLGGLSLQPSELVKPVFVVLSAWLLAERSSRPDMPVLPLAAGLFAVTAGLTAIQPDIGQTLLLTLVWASLFFVSGAPMVWIFGLGLLGGLVVVVSYFALGHVRARINAYLDPAASDTYQLDRARESFIEGGWFGRGPGEGTIKADLPDAHTDFIFAVIAEEYGIVACLVLIGLFAFVAGRALVHFWREYDPFLRITVAGLLALLAFQVLINMGVNVGLLPAKGMTLPFVSYGGSSLLGMSIAMGLLLAASRRRPGMRNRPLAR